MSAQASLVEDIVRFHNDPLGFILYTFPWGKPGTRLANETGPDIWQRELLAKLKEQLDNPGRDTALQFATTSGHGVGKTALTAWILLWFMSTRYHPQVVVTANTKAQLMDKTWRELSKWHQLAINKPWFEYTATRFSFISSPKTWFASAVPWSEHNSEAFAGTHEQDVLVIFDEASAISDVIWDVVSGAMTTPGAMHFAFGNPTRNTGRFFECFHRFRARWVTYQVDARKAKMVNQSQIEQWVADYGEDSDFVRVRVKGEFPRAAATQLIPLDLVEQAMQRAREEPDPSQPFDPVLLGVDVARYGDDQSVIVRRQGRLLHPLTRFRNLSTMDLASHVANHINQHQPDAVFVDAVGLGAGVVDRLRQLGFRVTEVLAGAKPQDETQYHNLRAEMWCRMKDWLATAHLPDDHELRDDLTGVEYGFQREMRLQLEKKEDMKARGLASPDAADALALTFAYPTRGREVHHLARTQRVSRAVLHPGRINDWRVL